MAYYLMVYDEAGRSQPPKEGRVIESDNYKEGGRRGERGTGRGEEATGGRSSRGLAAAEGRCGCCSCCCRPRAGRTHGSGVTPSRPPIAPGPVPAPASAWTAPGGPLHKFLRFCPSTQRGCKYLSSF